MLVRFLNWILKLRCRVRVKRNATMVGSNHLIGAYANVILMDGAKKEQVIIGDHCWCNGKIIVQSRGRVLLHKYAQIGPDSQILCVNSVEIGSNVTIAHNVTICDNNNHPVNPHKRRLMSEYPPGHDSKLWKHSASAPIVVGANCWIGTNARICKGVTIGENSIVAACAVVTKDVPANCIVAGNPAKVVRTSIDQIEW